MPGRTIGSGGADCTAERFGAISSVATATRLRAVFIDSPVAWVTWVTTAVGYRTCEVLRWLLRPGEAHKNVTYSLPPLLPPLTPRHAPRSSACHIGRPNPY